MADLSKREELWKEYEYARQGISDYDSYLFRIRHWNITITALFLVAVISARDELGPWGYSVAGLLIGGVSICFWIQDAANKSLQYVHIRCSKALEKSLALHCTCHPFRPSISHRFEARESKTAKRVLRRMWDHTVSIYYIPSMILSYLVICSAGISDVGIIWPSFPDFPTVQFVYDILPVLLGGLPVAILAIAFGVSRHAGQNEDETAYLASLNDHYDLQVLDVRDESTVPGCRRCKQPKAKSESTNTCK